MSRRLRGLEVKLRRAVARFKEFTCPEQARIALAFYEGTPADTLGILPTGMGKSLCYLLPTYLWAQEEGRALTVVVSPLLALMQDQVDRVDRHNTDIGEFNLTARQLNSGISLEERRKVRRMVRNHELNLLFLGPEAMVNPWTYEMLADAARNGTLRGLVIDEVHMIMEWGDEFRPDFRRMGPIRKLLQDAAPAHQPLRTLILTATLPPEERKDVLDALGIDGNPDAIECREIRSEHVLRVLRFANHEEKLTRLVTDVRRLGKTGAGIIYCGMRAHCEDIAELLNKKRLGPAEHFHGRTPACQRREILREFRDSSNMVVVATDAFGLGVDKPDVRWVLHFSMPDSLDQYYQEIGRGGRDREPCEALLYYSPADKGQAKRCALKALKTDKFYARLRCMREGSLVLSKSRRSTLRMVEEETIPDYVERDEGEILGKPAVRAHKTWNYAVLVRANELGWILLGPDVVYEARCMLAPRGTLDSANETAPLLAKAGLLQRLRRNRVVTLGLGKAAADLGLDVRALQRELFDLVLEGKVRLPDDGPAFDTRVLKEDHTIRNTAMLQDDVALRLGRQKAGGAQVEAMAAYAKSSKRCRRTHFYNAYGYADLIPEGGCGKCDVCMEQGVGLQKRG